ncbi:MAG: glycine cleavage system aminomethyltransferase GcvT [candidate division Zixibacteria bacterium]|nr:glycine cleavage system aminomethyltransferase GcvT [candidate division Zixibacteria bacterium]NIR65107.1 glycine cleavage system aminomethyltransferase GcvT [candidate division Zixibacteria bacterium]NIS17841.1 glycine cleavage system aminomethyltransferase GcvT [candidate division Zixibacteria bacterium]NIS46851.1 glycine cleavage system aminomethyltransferase GcvT [candidate division Zixibacteria bacterium]NIT54563.1 glycine cleavage system aminomethyltransferase GcvT [candidate division 
MSEAKKTPYYDKHIEAGARIAEFAGYLMPIQYKSINSEHLKVRNSVGMFDLSHMGEFRVSGNNAIDFLQKMTVNDVSELAKNQVHYTCMCYPTGGIVDDLLIYNRGDHYLMVVNAACLEKDFEWLKDHLEGAVKLENLSDQTGLLAIQGPNAEKVLSNMTDYNLSELAFYWSDETEIAGEKVLFSRTGYTGEDGFEIYHRPEIADKLWEAALDAGKELEIEPIGLGARDSLRMEMKYMLYGNDIDSTTNPVEAGLSWIVKLDKGDFIGKDAIAEVKENKPDRKLICFELENKGIPRHGYNIYSEGNDVGYVSSGTYSPVLEKGIGLGYVPRNRSKSGREIEIEIRGKRLPATIVKPPFYKDGSLKK